MEKGRTERTYTEEDFEMARAMFATYANMSYISRRLKIPNSTLRGWKKKFEKEEDYKTESAKIRQVKKVEMIHRSWRAIFISLTLLQKELEAMEQGRRAVDVDKLIRIVGTLYDKQALASCEPTEIVEGAIKRFEDFNDEDEQT